MEYLKTGLMEIQVWGQKPTDDEKKEAAAGVHRRIQTVAMTDSEKKELESVRQALQVLGVDSAGEKPLSLQVEELVKSHREFKIK